MATRYPTAVPDNNVGTVTQSKRTTVSFDITVSPQYIYYDSSDPDEYLLTVNGHVIRRMTRAQAHRLGLVIEREV